MGFERDTTAPQSRVLTTAPQQVIITKKWSIAIKKLKFSAQRSKKTRDFEKKISIQNFAKIA